MGKLRNEADSEFTVYPVRRDIVTLGQEVSRLQAALDAAQREVARLRGDRPTREEMERSEAGAAAMREALEGIAEDPGCGCTPCTGACQTKDTLRDELVEIREQAHAALQSTAGRALLERLERAERRVRELAVLEEESCQIVDLLGCGEDPVVEAVERVVRERDELKSGYARLDRIATQLQRAVDTEIANVRRMGDLSRKHEAERDAARAALAALRAVPAGTEAELARLRARVQDRDHIAAIVHTSWCAKVHSEPESEDYAAADVLVSWLTGEPRLATHVSERVRASVEADDTATPLLAGGELVAVPEASGDHRSDCNAQHLEGWICNAYAGHPEPMHAAYVDYDEPPIFVWPVTASSAAEKVERGAAPCLAPSAMHGAADEFPGEDYPSESAPPARERWSSRYGTRQAPVFVGPRQDMATGSSPVPAGCCAECRQREGHLMGCEHGAAIQPDVDAIVNTTAQETTR